MLNDKVMEENKLIKVYIPKGMWIKCQKCKATIYKDDFEKSHKVCLDCGYHFKISAKERIKTIIDENSFIELYTNIVRRNPINFEGYEQKLIKNEKKAEVNEAIVTGIGKINKKVIALAIMENSFMMGSMGCIVGEKLTKLIEYSTQNSLPLLIFSTSGGVRMQEGIFSLMQMAKVSTAICKHNSKKLLYISIITNPTFGGVTASFAMAGDIILSEPNAFIGFAGKKVVKTVSNEKLPEHYQTAEFALENGFIDDIVQRKDMRKYIDDILNIHK